MTGDATTKDFIVFVLYEWPGENDVPFFCAGVSVGGAEQVLAGPFQTSDAARAWIETQTIIGQAAAIP